MAAWVTTSMVLSDGEGVSTSVEARASVYHSDWDDTDTRYLSVNLGTSLKIQGPAADMLALVDRVRDALVAEMGSAWPVESSHAVSA